MSNVHELKTGIERRREKLAGLLERLAKEVREGSVDEVALVFFDDGTLSIAGGGTDEDGVDYFRVSGLFAAATRLAATAGQEYYETDVEED